MDHEDREFLKEFFNQLRDVPLEPDDSRYVPLYDRPDLGLEDPVELLSRGIQWTPTATVQLLSGFRGSGKSTELRRLRHQLQQARYEIVWVELRDYLTMSAPIAISDFLMVVGGAVSEHYAELQQPPLWERLADWLGRTSIKVEDVTGSAGVEWARVDIKASLRTDATFRQKFQRVLEGHISGLVEVVRDVVAESAERAHRNNPGLEGIVVVVDSTEHIRGTSLNAVEVQNSVEVLFAAHPTELRIEPLHMIYTVPPYLTVRYPGLGALYQPGGLEKLHPVKVTGRAEREPSPPGRELLRELVERRGDWRRLLGSEDTLDLLIGLSGGHFRDLFRFLSEILRRAEELPVSDDVVNHALVQVRSEYLPIPDDDVKWLAAIARTHSSEIPDLARLPRFSTFLDSHQVLCYSNGDEWYDVHPLIRDDVLEFAGGSDGHAG